MNARIDSQRDVIAFLSNPQTYGASESVEVHETHGSLVFLAGEHAYKLKRAVKYPYMDYSTSERRRNMCERELAVNRSAAPSLYEEVRAIVDVTGTLRFGQRGEGNAVDWVVVMHRFDQADLFESRRKHGTLTREDMMALAGSIANYHATAERVSGYGGAGGLRAIVAENVAILAEKCAGTELSDRVQELVEASQLWLRRTRDLLGRRRRAGFVRRCHGDLHLNNVCLIAGAPVLFDAIEFNDAFSCIDVFYDLAFMLMDLDWHGLRGHANALLNRYAELMGDDGGLAALPLFLSCRAAIRAHVAISTLQSASVGSIEATAPARLLEAAGDYLEPPPAKLIAVGGVSGTGKSTLARSLAPVVGAAPGALVLRSDVVRKSLMGVAETDRLYSSAYGPEPNAAVYRQMCEVAARALRAGHSVIVDAVCGEAWQQAQVAAVAQAASVPFHGLWLGAPLHVLEERVLKRSADVSDATVPVLLKQVGTVSVPEQWQPVETEKPASEVLADVRRLIGVDASLAL